MRDTARTLQWLVRNKMDDSANCLIRDPGPDALAELEMPLEEYQRSEVERMLGGVAKQLSTKRMQADILGQAASHDGIMHRTDDIRARRNVLNFSNCTVALDSREWWAHDPRDLITHCLPYAWDPSAQCPEFRRLVWCMTGPEDDWSDAHGEMFAFVLRVLGYCLIYGNPEQLVFFLTGPTKTGKTTVIEIAGRLLGTLAHKSKPVLITEPPRGDQHDSVRWSVRNKRLVYVDETKRKMRVDVSALKDLSGGSVFTVRKLRAAEELQAPVTFTIVVPTNEMPAMIGGDDAVAERIVKIPCAGQTIPAAQRVCGYGERIVAQEGPGILALLVEYARRYYAEGLPRPAAAVKASEDYMRDEDSAVAFREECCTADLMRTWRPNGPETWEPAREERNALWKAYEEWAGRQLHLNRNDFYAEVRRWGGTGEVTVKGRRFFTGIRLQRAGE